MNKTLEPPISDEARIEVLRSEACRSVQFSNNILQLANIFKSSSSSDIKSKACTALQAIFIAYSSIGLFDVKSTQPLPTSSEKPTTDTGRLTTWLSVQLNDLLHFLITQEFNEENQQLNMSCIDLLSSLLGKSPRLTCSEIRSYTDKSSLEVLWSGLIFDFLINFLQNPSNNISVACLEAITDKLVGNHADCAIIFFSMLLVTLDHVRCDSSERRKRKLNDTEELSLDPIWTDIQSNASYVVENIIHLALQFVNHESGYIVSSSNQVNSPSFLLPIQASIKLRKKTASDNDNNTTTIRDALEGLVREKIDSVMPTSGLFEPKMKQTTRKLFSSVWTSIHSLVDILSPSMTLTVLTFAPTFVFPHMEAPLLLSECYAKHARSDDDDDDDIVAITALHGISVLMSEYALEYDGLYTRLYQLCEPRCLTSCSFCSIYLVLLDKCLKSSHIPIYIVCAFAKKLTRACLFLPPHTNLVILSLLTDIIFRYKGLVCGMIQSTPSSANTRNGFNSDEVNDLSKTGSLETCLWELEAIQGHYYQVLADRSMLLSTNDITDHRHPLVLAYTQIGPIPTVTSELLKQMHDNDDDDGLIKIEMERTINAAPTLSKLMKTDGVGAQAVADRFSSSLSIVNQLFSF